jgi:hypothetical protein
MMCTFLNLDGAPIEDGDGVMVRANLQRYGSRQRSEQIVTAQS